jgi:chemotaxis-related protein WspB
MSGDAPRAPSSEAAMLFLQFYLGEEHYLLDVHEIVEVLPLVDLKPLPQSPPSVAGVFNYRSTLVPTIDLAQVRLGRAAQVRFHTRVVVVRFLSEGGASHLLGLIAERVTETFARAASDRLASESALPYLNTVVTDGEGIAHREPVSRLLPADVRSWLLVKGNC